MNDDLSTLYRAFELLEQQADAAEVNPIVPRRRLAHRVTYAAAPIGAAALVAAGAATVAMWPHPAGHDPSGGGPVTPVSPTARPHPPIGVRPTAPPPTTVRPTATTPPVGPRPTTGPPVGPRPTTGPPVGPRPTTGPPVGPRPTTPPPAPPRPTTPGEWIPPSTSGDLAAKARAILAGIATITVVNPDAGNASGRAAHDRGPTATFAPPPPPGAPTAAFTPPRASTAPPPAPASTAPVGTVSPSAGSGAAILGLMTSADGVTGGYALDVFDTTPGSEALCDADTNCTVRTRPDGSLAVGHTDVLGGGVTYQVEFVRSDGAEILLHLSTEADTKGDSAVLGDHPPLTVRQMIAFVTSDQW